MKYSLIVLFLTITQIGQSQGNNLLLDSLNLAVKKLQAKPKSFQNDTLIINTLIIIAPLEASVLSTEKE